MIRLSAVFLSVMFIVLLLLPQFGLLLNMRDEGENIQNRIPAQFPAVSSASLLSALFSERLNEYVWDHLPLRSRLLSADHWIDYYVFKDSPVPEQVLLGRNGWLFFYYSVMIWPRKNAQIVEQFIALARRAQSIQKKTGMEIIIMPSPSKASIYPEFLTDYQQSEYTPYASAFHDQLVMEASSDVTTLLLLWDAFRQKKARLLDEKFECAGIDKGACYLFHPRSRHFGWETAIYQAELIVDRMAPGIWRNDFYEPFLTKVNFRASEMQQRFIKIDLPESYIDFRINEFLGEHEVSKTTRTIEKTDYRAIYFETKDNATIRPVPKRVVVIHDSFMNKSMYLLIPYFQEMIFMHWNISDNKAFFSETIREADILLIEAVEGFWHFKLNILGRIIEELESL